MTGSLLQVCSQLQTTYQQQQQYDVKQSHQLLNQLASTLTSMNQEQDRIEMKDFLRVIFLLRDVSIHLLQEQNNNKTNTPPACTTLLAVLVESWKSVQTSLTLTTIHLIDPIEQELIRNLIQISLLSTRPSSSSHKNSLQEISAILKKMLSNCVTWPWKALQVELTSSILSVTLLRVSQQEQQEEDEEEETEESIIFPLLVQIINQLGRHLDKQFLLLQQDKEANNTQNNNNNNNNNSQLQQQQREVEQKRSFDIIYKMLYNLLSFGKNDNCMNHLRVRLLSEFVLNTLSTVSCLSQSPRHVTAIFRRLGTIWKDQSSLNMISSKPLLLLSQICKILSKDVLMIVGSGKDTDFTELLETLTSLVVLLYGKTSLRGSNNDDDDEIVTIVCDNLISMLLLLSNSPLLASHQKAIDKIIVPLVNLLAKANSSIDYSTNLSKMFDKEWSLSESILSDVMISFIQAFLYRLQKLSTQAEQIVYIQHKVTTVFIKLLVESQGIVSSSSSSTSAAAAKTVNTISHIICTFYTMLYTNSYNSNDDDNSNANVNVVSMEKMKKIVKENSLVLKKAISSSSSSSSSVKAMDKLIILILGSCAIISSYFPHGNHHDNRREDNDNNNSNNNNSNGNKQKMMKEYNYFVDILFQSLEVWIELSRRGVDEQEDDNNNYNNNNNNSNNNNRNMSYWMITSILLNSWPQLSMIFHYHGLHSSQVCQDLVQILNTTSSRYYEEKKKKKTVKTLLFDWCQLLSLAHDAYNNNNTMIRDNDNDDNDDNDQQTVYTIENIVLEEELLQPCKKLILLCYQAIHHHHHHSNSNSNNSNSSEDCLSFEELQHCYDESSQTLNSIYSHFNSSSAASLLFNRYEGEVYLLKAFLCLLYAKAIFLYYPEKLSIAIKFAKQAYSYLYDHIGLQNGYVIIESLLLISEIYDYEGRFSRALDYMAELNSYYQPSQPSQPSQQLQLLPMNIQYHLVNLHLVRILYRGGSYKVKTILQSLLDDKEMLMVMMKYCLGGVQFVNYLLTEVFQFNTNTNDNDNDNKQQLLQSTTTTTTTITSTSSSVSNIQKSIELMRITRETTNSNSNSNSNSSSDGSNKAKALVWASNTRALSRLWNLSQSTTTITTTSSTKLFSYHVTVPPSILQEQERGEGEYVKLLLSMQDRLSFDHLRVLRRSCCRQTIVDFLQKGENHPTTITTTTSSSLPWNNNNSNSNSSNSNSSDSDGDAQFYSFLLGASSISTASQLQAIHDFHSIDSETVSSTTTTTTSTSASASASTAASVSVSISQEILKATSGNQNSLKNLQNQLKQIIKDKLPIGSIICFLCLDHNKCELLLGRLNEEGSCQVMKRDAKNIINILKEFDNNMILNYKSLQQTSSLSQAQNMTSSQKKAWWILREEIDKQLKLIADRLEEELGDHIRLLLPSKQHNSSNREKSGCLINLDELILSTEELQINNEDDDDEGEEEEKGSDVDYESMKLVDLRLLAKERGLSTTGRKLDIIERLIEFNKKDKTLNNNNHNNNNNNNNNNNSNKSGMISSQPEKQKKPINNTNSNSNSNSNNNRTKSDQQHHNHHNGGGHVILILDEILQTFPIEILPSLRQQSCSRIPSLSLLLQSSTLSTTTTTTNQQFSSQSMNTNTITITSNKHDNNNNNNNSRCHSIVELDRRRCWYAVDIDQNLPETRKNMESFLQQYVNCFGWKGIIGKMPSQEEISEMNAWADWYIYSGHGAGDKIFKILSDPIQHRGALLWGCSSGKLTTQGLFDPEGSALQHLQNGCSMVAGNLWDVTDRDLDKLSVACMEKALTIQQKISDERISFAKALGEARDVCKLKYAVAGAAIMYGLPMLASS